MTSSPDTDAPAATSTDRATTPPPTATVTLPPSYRIPIALGLIALPIAALQIWVGGVIGGFALFLLVQTITLRLVFTDTALDVYRGDRIIRHFPYAEWQRWDIFWSPVPILFYFREVNSIHFLPMLFQPTALRIQLAARLPHLAADAADSAA